METHELTTRITRQSLSRRVTVFVLFLSILAVGLIATSRLPVEMYPKGQEGHSMEIRTGWSSGVAQESMEKLGLPMEEELSTVRGIDSMDTTCSQTSARVNLRFKRGTDMDVAYREVRDRMERASLRFPEGTNPYRISKRGGGTSTTVGRMVIGYDAYADHYAVIERHIIKPLQRIDGVADVDIGIRQKDIQIEVDKDRAEAYGLSIHRLSRRLRGDNFTMSSGSVRDGGKKYLLKSSSTFHTMDELRNIPINDTVQLKDIATLKYEVEDPHHPNERWNGKASATVSIRKESEANTVDVSEMVAATVQKMQHNNPALSNYQIELYRNYGDIIKSRLKTLRNNGMLGAIFAALVLFFFLRQFRMTAIIALAIPLCLLISMMMMFFDGESLNTTTIRGLVICVGLLVDNSVVVAENIYRHHQNGMSRSDACIRGVGEISLAVITATLTTIIVFLPSLLIDGEMRFMLYRLALPVVSALLASLGTAIIFIPICDYITLPSRPKQQDIRSDHSIKTLLFNVYQMTFTRFNLWYNRTLGYFLRRRLDLAFILIVLLSTTYFYAFKEVDFSGRRDEQIEEFHMSFRFPDQFTLEERDSYFETIENIVETNKVEYGISSYSIRYSKHSGSFEGNFAETRNSKTPREEVAEQLYNIFPEIPGLRVYYSGQDRGEVRNDKKSEQFVRLVGDDPQLLESVAENLKPTFEALPGVISLMDRDSDEAPNEMALVVDRDLASSIGINPDSIAGVVSSAIRGSSLPKFNGKGRQIPVRMRFSEEDRAELDDLNNFLVRADDGRYSSIGSITTPAMLKSETYIRRHDKKVSTYIGMKLKSGEEKEARRAIYNAQKNIDLPEGVSFREIKLTFDDDEVDTSLIALGLSIIFIYMLIAFLFESMLMPLSIVLTIPLAAIGAVWMHYGIPGFRSYTGTTMDQMGIVGAILLLGIVVNNGIVLIDYVNRLRKTGMERTEALLLATKHRFRPIIMTALTTIFGMIPLTLASESEMGMSFKSFGFMLIGGMTSATLFTLLAVPVFYTLIDDAQKALRNILATVFDGSPKATAAN